MGHALVVNTMGYTSGMGELLLYEIYQIVKPNRILAMEGNSSSPVSHILDSIRGQHYVKRLFFTSDSNGHYCSIDYFRNNKARSKGEPERFVGMFASE